MGEGDDGRDSESQLAQASAELSDGDGQQGRGRAPKARRDAARAEAQSCFVPSCSAILPLVFLSCC